MKLLRALVAAALLAMLVSGLMPVGLNPISPAHLTKGKSTLYEFSFVLDRNVSQPATVDIGFPAEYNYTVLASQLTCYYRTNLTSWAIKPCSLINKKVVVQAGQINVGMSMVSIDGVLNPTGYNMSSMFTMVVSSNQVPVDSNELFGKVAFSDPPAGINISNVVSIANPLITPMSSLTVGQGSTYQFTFQLNAARPVGSTVRITFPVGYTSNNPVCRVSSVYNLFIQTYVLANNRSVQCRQLNKTLSQENITIVGMYNPLWADTFGNGNNGDFIIEVLQESSSIVLEQRTILSTVAITPGLINTKITPGNLFVLANVRYEFAINLFNSLNSTDYMRIRFPMTWTLFEDSCKVLAGWQLAAGQNLSCHNYTDQSYKYLNVTNFLAAPRSLQQSMSINLTTPMNVPTAPGYEIEITTWNYKGLMDRSLNYVQLNSTIGTINMLSIDAVEAGIKVPAGGTGPLELTFFLNYNLYQTNVLTSGQLVCSIFPQIPTPPVDVNGIVKCFFFGTVQASKCIYDVSQSDRTTITIGTPETYDYQYSEIPITITTDGAISPDKIGLTISSIVQRYNFQCAFYNHNSSTIPTEVYYSEYIADAIQIPTITARSLTYETGEWTHLQINLTNPYSLINASKEFRFKVEFSQSSWDSALGYNPDDILRQYPCTLGGVNVAADPFVQCDLYSYGIGPYTTIAQTNPPSPGPYIIVYGFRPTLLIGDSLILELPKLKISPGGSGTTASIRFSILEETPAMLEPYVEIFYSNVVVFTTLVGSSVPLTLQTLVPNPPSPDTINAMASYTFNWNIGTTADSIVYIFDKTQVPTIYPNVFTCTTSNRCVGVGYPANWVVEYPTGSVGPAVSTTIPANLIQNARFAGSFPFKAVAYRSGMVVKRVSFQVTYTPQTLLLPLFNLDVVESAAAIYKGVEHYYQINFKTVTPTNNTNFIRFAFGNNCEVGALPYCESATLSQLDSRGILCTRESATSMKIYNIQGLLASTVYDVKVRLVNNLASTSPTTPTVSIYINADIASDPSVTDQVLNVPTAISLANLYTTPADFTIKNPRLVVATQKAGYIGPLEIQFVPAVSTNPIASLTVTLYPHNWNTGFWSTPRNLASDPMVCRLNSVRVPCSWNIAPLTFTIQVVGVTVGQAAVNVIRLESEYLVNNGLAYPLFAGYYLTKLTYTDTLNVQVGANTFYTRVDPPELFDFFVSSTLSDINTESLYIVRLTALPTLLPNSYADPSLYSRIVLEFPTRDSQNNRLFEDALVGYSKTGDYVGCYFNATAQFVVAANPTISPMKCRLIKSETFGQPVRIEIINHGAFMPATPSMEIYIGKIWNPATAVKSVEIGVRVDHVANGSNRVIELYHDTFELFLDPQSKVSPGLLANSMDLNTNQFFTTGQDVTDINGYLYLTSQSFGIPVSGSYYFVIKLPPYLQVQNNQVAPTSFFDCSPMSFVWCISLPEINYVIVNSRVNGSIFKPYLTHNPMSISQVSSYFYSDVWEDRRYVGTVTYDISPTRWLQIQGAITLNSITVVGYPDKANMLKKDLEILVDFTVANPINLDGTVEIRFPAIITGIRSHCRSAVAAGSLLYSQGGAYGEIGCTVQSRSWVITGFQPVTGPMRIKISGKIDIPSISGVDIGIGEIITYADQHNTNIYANGSRIDYVSTAFNLAIPSTPAFNVDTETTMWETLPLRINYVGSFRIIFQLPTDLQPLNVGSIMLRLNQYSIMGVAGGFSYDGSKKVCEFTDIATTEKLGCIVTSQTNDLLAGYQNVMYKVIASSTLLSTKKYLLTLTSQRGSEPEGIYFPAIAGTYKVDVNADFDGSATYPIHTHTYMEVYGTTFNRLVVTSFVTSPGRPNLLWIDLSPNTPITSTHQIVIEFPTMSNDGVTALFDNDLGMNYLDYSIVFADVFDCAPYDAGNFMQCQFFLGSSTTQRAAKIVCGSLNLGVGTIPVGSILKFAIKIQNPNSAVQISLPIVVYTHDPVNQVKTNFNFVDNAVYLQPPTGIVVDLGNFITGGGRLETSGDTLKFTSRNMQAMNAGDYYVVFMSFPLRNNGKILGGCQTAAGGAVGNVYYHWHTWAIVCEVLTPVAIPAPGTTIQNLMFQGFFTPWYLLTTLERVVICHASYLFTLGYSVEVNHHDDFPLLLPRIVFPTISTLTMQPIMGHNVGNQEDDYIITVRLESAASTNLNLQYCKMVSIEFPLTTVADFVMHNTDCVQQASSQIEVDSCRVDISQRAIFIGIVQKNYTNGQTLKILTRNRAIKNPYNNISNTNMKDFVVRFYSWENVTYSAANGNSYTYLMMDSTNINPVAMPFSLFPTSPAPVPTVPINPFYVGMFPHQRYFNEFVPYTTSQYAPFNFDLSFPVAYPGGLIAPNYNTLTVYFGASFTTIFTVTRIWDLYYYKPICYLNNNRVIKCSLSSATNTITMKFLFTVPAGVAVNVYVSMLDPRNHDINGFRFIGTPGVTMLRIETQPFGGNLYTIETDSFDAYQTTPFVQSNPYRAISYGTISSMHCVANKLNVLTMQLWFNSAATIVKGLVFEIPVRDELGQPIYSNPTAAFFTLDDGAPYPCGNNGLGATGAVKCFLEKGDPTLLGAPVRIHMTDFYYTGGTMKVRLLLQNPDANTFLSVKVKAYGSSKTTTSVYGINYLGYFNFMYVIQALPSAYTPGSATGYFYPQFSNRLIWRYPEQFILSRIIPSPGPVANAPALSVSILEVPLQGTYGYNTDKKICEATFFQGTTAADDVLFLNLRNDVTGVITRKAYFIKTWAAADSVWYIQYIQCKHVIQPFIAYYANSDIDVYEISHSIPNGAYVNSFTDAAALVYWDFTSNRGQASHFIMEYDLSTSLGSTANFAFLSGSNYYMRITTVGNFWTASGFCEVAGGLSNSYGGKPSCSWISSTQMLITGFDKIDYDAYLGTYRLKVMFTSSSYSTGVLYSVSGAIEMWTGPDAYNNLRETIFTLSATNALDRRMSSVYQGIFSSINSGDLGTFTVSTITTTSTSLYMSMSYNPAGTLSFSTDYVYMYWTFQVHNFKIPAWSSIYAVFTYDSGYQLDVSSCMQYVSVNQFRYNGAACGWWFSTYSGLYSWSGLGSLQVTITTPLGLLVSERRDWIGVGMIIEGYRYYSYPCCYCCGCCCSCCITTCWAWAAPDIKAVGYDVYNSATKHALANAANITLKALNIGAYTQFGFYLTVLQTNIGVSTNKILLVELIDWTSGYADPFPYTDPTVSNHQIECQCYTNLGTLDLRTAVSYTTPNCYRRQPIGGYLNYAITVDVAASVNHDLTCFFPEFQVPSLAFRAQMKLITVNSFPYYVAETGTYYGGYNKIISGNTLTPTSSAVTSGLGVYETPSVYPGAPLKYVGNTLTGAYSITVPFSIVTDPFTPYIYIKFQSGGPIPLHDLCGNNGIFQECRAYSRFLIYVIAAQLFIPEYTVDFVKVATLSYPTSRSVRALEYDTIIYVERYGYYQTSGVISRTQSQLKVRPVLFYAYPDLFGTAKSNYQTNIIFSFGMAGRNLNPASTGARFVINWTLPFTYSKGCVAYVELTPSAQLDCRVFSNELWVTSATQFSTSYNIYVVMGIMNPTSNIQFKLTLYEYYRDANHYGTTIMQDNNIDYTVDNAEGLAGKSLLPKSSIRMYPFQTKITRTNSALIAPLRFWFNLPGTALTPMSWVKTGGGGQFRVDYAQSTNSAYQECFFREYDSWTTLIQHTQSRLFYADCSSAAGIITVNVPKPRALDNTKWYELVILPLDTIYNINSGYGNQQEQVRITAYQVSPATIWSAQTIQTNKLFYGTGVFTLNSIYYLTVQPVKQTSLQIKFTFNSNYFINYPNHWFEILFYDLGMISFAPTYSYASQLPCVLSASFTAGGGRTYAPRCVLNQFDNFVPIIKIRVENIGSVLSGTYTLAIDDFNLLDLSALQEPTRRFDIGLVYVNVPSNIYFQTFYPEVLLEDGNTPSGAVGPAATFNNPASVQYGAGVTGNIQFSYPFDTTVTGLYQDYKMTIRWNGGYSAVWNSISSLTFGSYSVLWADSINRLIVLTMPTPAGHPINFLETLSVTGLVNPYAYQRQIYEFTNSITLTFFSQFYTQSWMIASQPPYSIYTRAPSLVTVNQTAPTNNIDIYNNANTLPSGMKVVWRLQITVSETYANLNLRRLHRFEVRFTSGVGTVTNCWVNDVAWSYYNLNAKCQVSQDGLAIELFGFISTRVTSGLNVQVELTVTSSPVQYTSSLYAINNEIEYQNTYSVSVALLNVSRSLPTYYGYPEQKYVSNYYEYQTRYVQSVAGASTPVLKFRFVNPVALTYTTDILNIYSISDVQPTYYQNAINLTNMICTFLPVLGNYHQYGIGTFSPCSNNALTTPKSYKILAPYGNLAAGFELLLQIRENNIITTRFTMPTAPSRDELVIESSVFPGSLYRDNIVLEPYAFFTFAQIQHTTTTINDLNTLTVLANPAVTQAAVAAPNELVMTLTYNPIYSQATQDMGLPTLYSNDGLGNFKSGYLHSHNLNPAAAAATTVMSFGQYSNSYAPVRISMSLQNGYTSGTTQTWKIPLLVNPSQLYSTLSYTLWLKLYNTVNGSSITLCHYDMINQYYTQSNTSGPLGITLTNTNNMVQSSTVDLAAGLATYSIPQWSMLEMKWDNTYHGLLTIPDIMSNCNDGNYNCYYFPRLNLLHGEKKTLSTLYSMYLGATQLSNDYVTQFGFKWAKVLRTSNAQLPGNPFTLYTDSPALKTLNFFGAYTAPSLSLLQGLTNINSVGLYQFTFTVPRVPAGGEIDLLMNPAYFTFPSGRLGYECTALTNLKSTAEQRVLRCFQNTASNMYVLSGFDALSPVTNTTITITAYMKVAGYIGSLQSFSVNTYGQLYDYTKKIVIGSIGTVALSSATAVTSANSIEQFWSTYYASTTTVNEYKEIEATITLRNSLLTNPDTFEFEQPWYRDPLSTQRLIYRPNITVTSVDWMEPPQTINNTYLATYTLPVNHLLNYDIPTGNEYTLRLASYFSTAVSNLFNSDKAGTASKFWLRTTKSGSIYTQLNYYEVIKQPHTQLLTVVNRYTAASRATMLELSFTIVDEVILPKDTIQISFDSSNLLATMFPIDAEGSPDALGQRLLDCQEPGTTLIDPSKLTCQLQYGSTTANPPTPAVLSIPVVSTIPLTTTVTILIGNVMNPTTPIVTGVTLRIQRLCRNRRNEYCPVFVANGYYTTTLISETNLISGTFTPSSFEVLNTNVNHVFTFTAANPIAINQAIYIVYPQNYKNVMPLTCTAGAHKCFVFPTRNWVTVIPTSAIAAGSVTITLSGMNNGYYLAPTSLYFKLTVVHGSIGELFRINHNSLVTLKRNPLTNTATSMTITPTQTPNIFLRNYMNTVVIELKCLWESNFAKAFYIVAPSTDVTVWDTNYCNATLTVPTTSRVPYPYRLRCGAISTTVLQVLIPSDFPTFDPSYQELVITVNAKFMIKDFPLGTDILYVSPPMTSGLFHAYGSASAFDSTWNYYISECFTPITISQHKVPTIGQSTFNTKSFSDRRGRTNDKVIYYMLLKPTTTVPVKKMRFYLPREFGYPPVGSHDNCKMITRLVQNIQNCVETREAGQTVLTVNTATTYDNGPRIIQLANSNMSNWFTAPAYPGDFYNMTIEMYDGSNTLLEKQTANLTDVWGQYLDIAGLTFVNGLDSLMNQIFDFTFIVGTAEIPPGYQATGTNMSSEIQFIFENMDGFNDDIGTGLGEGDELGCIVLAGLVPGPNPIKCALHLGSTYLDQPFIRVTNYRTIAAGTKVTISVANIKNLATLAINTVYVAVNLFYYNINEQAFLYRPISKLMLNTTDLATVPFTACNVSYPGNNVVLIPTTLNISITPTYNIKTTDYLVVTFPPNTIDPFNPTTVTCSNCIVYIYYKAGVIRLYPTTAITAGTAATFSLVGFPTSAYALPNVTLTFKIDGYLNGKQKNSNNVSLQRLVEKCVLSTGTITFVSSRNGGEVNVTYVFSFVLNIHVPVQGAITITVPSAYGNMLNNHATCNISLPSPSYCVVATPNRIDVYLNGTVADPLATYKVQVTGLSNPNVATMTGLDFTLTSYFDSNVYQSHKICENSISPPSIMQKSIRNCGFSLNVDFYNAGYPANYNFLISCTDVIRANSTLYIFLNSNYNVSNPVAARTCQSHESTTLVSPNCTLQFINGSYALVLPVKSSANQLSVTVQTQFVNPTPGTYAFSAKFFSDGILFSTTNNYTTAIFNNTFTTGIASLAGLWNVPRGAGTEAFYVFKLPSVTLAGSAAPDTLTIYFPSNFINKLGDGLKATAITSTDATLFSKLTYLILDQITSNATNSLGLNPKWTTPLTINALDSIITISGLGSFLKGMPTNNWAYYIISGVLNPSVYVNQTFTLIYSEGVTVNSIVNWLLAAPLVYYIRATPSYMVIDSLTATDYDTSVTAQYNLTVLSTSSILAPNKKLAVIVLLPMFYNDTYYADINLTCTISNPLPTDYNCSLYGNELVTTLSTSATTNLKNVTIGITKLFNPTGETFCNTTDVTMLERTYFRVRVLDLTTNEIIMQTSPTVDQSTCLQFSSYRTPITISYYNTVQTGLISSFNFSINRTTNSLKVVPYCSNSGITFNPPTIDFSKYSISNITTSLVVGSNVLPGKYWINFTKFESTGSTFYKPILPVLITVVAGTNQSNNATIAAKLTTYSYIGYPIVVPIVLSVPSASPMTLVIAVKEEFNGSLLSYSKAYGNYSVAPRVINISAGVSEVNFTILYYNNTVPPGITLLLSISSLYPLYYTLTTPVLYVSFQKDPKYQGIYVPMKVTVSNVSFVSTDDVGKSILNVFVNNQTQNVSFAPVIIAMNQTMRGSTWSNLLINTKEEYTLYWCVLEQGYTEPTAYSDLTTLSYPNCRDKGRMQSTKNPLQLVNCEAWVNSTILECNTKYNLFAVAYNSMGYSPVSKLTFTTAELSLGAEMKLSLNGIVPANKIITALQQTLGISASRIKVTTSYLDLQNMYKANNTNTYNYTYTVVIAPNPINDLPAPIDLVGGMVNSSAMLASLGRNLDSWNQKSPIPYRLVTMVRPKVASYPVPKLIYFYNATFSVKFWEQAKVYAILMENFMASPLTLNFTNTTNQGSRASQILIPSSKQIRYAKDLNNTVLNVYRYFSGTSDSKGHATIFFNDLKPGSDYIMYMTAANMLPYEPSVLLNDTEVGVLSFHTIHNPSNHFCYIDLNSRRVDMRDSSNPLVQDLINLKPNLGWAIKKYLDESKGKLIVKRR